jgi:hypothetical protein
MLPQLSISDVHVVSIGVPTEQIKVELKTTTASVRLVTVKPFGRLIDPHVVTVLLHTISDFMFTYSLPFPQPHPI